MSCRKIQPHWLDLRRVLDSKPFEWICNHHKGAFQGSLQVAHSDDQKPLREVLFGSRFGKMIDPKLLLQSRNLVVLDVQLREGLAKLTRRDKFLRSSPGRPLPPGDEAHCGQLHLRHEGYRHRKRTPKDAPAWAVIQSYSG